MELSLSLFVCFLVCRNEASMDQSKPENLLSSGDDILVEIASHFPEMTKVVALASHLLERTCNEEGSTFVAARSQAITNPHEMAHAVLVEWCEKFPKESTRSMLYHVLHIVHRTTAYNFQRILLPQYLVEGKMKYLPQFL